VAQIEMRVWLLLLITVMRLSGEKETYSLPSARGGLSMGRCRCGQIHPIRTCFARNSSTAVIPSDAFCVRISIV